MLLMPLLSMGPVVCGVLLLLPFLPRANFLVSMARSASTVWITVMVFSMVVMVSYWAWPMIWIWVGGMMGIAFFLFDLAKLLRVSVQDETYGLDASHHGGMDDDLVNALGADALMKMRDDGFKLDKTVLLAMCIDQNVQPLP